MTDHKIVNMTLYGGEDMASGIKVAIGGKIYYSLEEIGEAFDRLTEVNKGLRDSYWSADERADRWEKENAILKRKIRGYEDPNAIFEGDEIWYGWKERALTAEKERDGLKEYSESRDESIKAYREEIKELREWKNSQLEVESTWNPQEVAKILGIGLGENIRANILPRIKELKEDLERERMRLAACGITALANTEGTIKQRLDKDNQYYSASYGDVCDAVDREMELRERLKGINYIGNGERNEYHDGWNNCVDAVKKACEVKE